jgi:hypothetical protein
MRGVSPRAAEEQCHGVENAVLTLYAHMTWLVNIFLPEGV